jgi:lipid II:glycine glycyltransferase (peptidoglycan interpeptide bridge formation enzyme)
MEKKLENLEFLQSAQWRQFQANVGRKTFCLESEDFLASIIEHSLPIVGKYLYCPKGPVFFAETKKNLKSQISNSNGTQNSISNFKFSCLPAYRTGRPDRQAISSENQNSEIQNTISNSVIKSGMQELIELAEKEKAGWIRIEPEDEKILETIRNAVEIGGNNDKKNIRPRRTDYKIIKAPHDMQPREIFVVDITKDAETLLSEMKAKTRYNIKLAEKRGVVVSHQPASSADKSSVISHKEKHLKEFLKLTKEMATRHGITAHPENYYQKMIETLPSEMLRIYAAEFEGKIIAANLVLFFGKTATYLHGASGNAHRDVMAPYLLQWQAILDAKELGFEKYDFGGIKSTINNQKSKNNKNTWEGITTFKLGFSPNTVPVEFPGSYDIVVNPRKYGVYKILQKLKKIFRG